MADTSASPTSPAEATTVQFKEFRCTYPSCTKSFSRAEHLHRHALNHTCLANNTCLRCSAVFKRSDLLDRHMLRHKEKDDEAGGEGLGTLQTRKRLWRDENGTVHQKRRPEHEKKRTNSSSTPRKPQMRAPPVDDNINPDLRNEPLPPLKSLQILPQRVHLEMALSQEPRVMRPEMWPVPSAIDEASQGPPPESFDFLCNASWGTLPAEANDTQLLYNDIFTPDTASSFNMPFTTMNYYTWLFDSSLPSVESMQAPIVQMSHSTSSSRGLSISDASGESNQDGRYHDHPSHALKDSRSISGYSSESYTRDLPTPETSAANQILAMSQAASTNITASLGYKIVPAPVIRNLASHSSGMNIPNQATQPTHTPPSYSQTSPFQNRPRKLPIIVENARLGILSFIAEVRPKDADGGDIAVDHPLLSLSNLQKYCDLFFSRFNISYPLLHAATFDPARIDPLLLLSVLLLGATYDHKDSHLFAIGIHDSMRAQIFASKAFNTQPMLWMLQTILLVECFGKSRAGQLQHDMSHLFHGLLINLIRRSDCQSARCQDLSEIVDLEQRWKAEAEVEQKRRLALLCFMWDTQHAVLFSQSLCMNAAELRLTLPWNEALFDAQNAKEWCALNSIERPQPQYLTVLKTYINQHVEANARPLNALSRILILHGLMSVAWDLNRRDQTSLGLSLHKDLPWQALVARAYHSWKADFDNFTTSTLQALSPAPSAFSTISPISDIDTFNLFVTSTSAIYHAAQILLQVEINDLQIFAGASHIIGRAISKQDRDSSRSKIERWAQPSSMSAAKAASHASFLLRDGMFKLNDWDAGDAFHYPWCLYLATLTMWTFQVCSKKAEQGGDDNMSDGEEDSDSDATAEVSALVTAMTRANLGELWKVAGKYRSSDLPRIMARHLSCIRWAVVQEGAIVLRGLEGRGGMA